jgi:uncharacterized membrane protein
MITTAIVLAVALVIIAIIAGIIAYAAIQAIIGLIIPIVVIIGVIIALMVLFGIIGAVLKYKKHRDTMETVREVKSANHRGGDKNVSRNNYRSNTGKQHEETVKDSKNQQTDSVCSRGEEALGKYRR